jgi:hypothetical protein
LAEIATVAVYVPEARPVGSTEILSDPGVVPPEGVTDSHVPPCAAAVKLRGEPVLVTRIDLGEGRECPDSYSK